MTEYVPRNGVPMTLEAKQLSDENAVNLSVWLDFHQVSNTLYTNSPDLGVGSGEDFLRATPGMWVGVAARWGFVVLPDAEFQRYFLEVVND